MMIWGYIFVFGIIFGLMVILLFLIPRWGGITELMLAITIIVISYFSLCTFPSIIIEKGSVEPIYLTNFFDTVDIKLQDGSIVSVDLEDVKRIKGLVIVEGKSFVKPEIKYRVIKTIDGDSPVVWIDKVIVSKDFVDGGYKRYISEGYFDVYKERR